MEIAITIPLFLLFLLEYHRQGNPYLLGLLASLTILSRLDSIIIFITFLGADLIYKKINTKRLTQILLGTAPVALYLLSNLYYFDLLFPVSGLAKSVLDINMLHMQSLECLFAYEPVKLIFLLSYLFVICNYSIIKKSSTEIKVVCLTAILCVPLFYIQTSLRSDWALWRWYFYPLILSFIMFFAPLNTIADSIKFKISQKAQIAALYVILAGTFILPIIAYNKIVYKTHFSPPLFQAGMQIANFAKTHPGTYAMGDRAGVVGYLLESPIVQLEGLVMDKHYLKLLENSKHIVDILDHYQVDYYIGYNLRLFGYDLRQSPNNCFTIVEPSQSGGYSRQIESQLCWEEIFYCKFGNETNRIFQRQHQ